MRSFRDMNPYVVGLASMLVIGAITGFAFMIGLLNLLEKAYDVEAHFADSGGIGGGDDVKIAGVKVGRVVSVAPDRNNGLVVVKMKVNNGVEVREDATAEIALETLLGGAHVRIKDAAAGDQLLEDLPASDRIIEYDPLTSRTPFDVFELTRIATEGIEELDKEALNQLIVSAADITEDKGETIRRLASAITQVGRAVNTRDDKLAELFDEAADLTGKLAEKDETLVELLDVSDRILRLLIDRRDELALVLGETADTVDELSRIITTHKLRLDAILTTLHPTLDLVDEHQPDLDIALAWLGPGLLQQSRGGTHGPFLDLFIRSAGPDVVQIYTDIYRDLLGVPDSGAGP